MIKDWSHILAQRYAYAFINLFYNQLSDTVITSISQAAYFLNTNPRLSFFLKLVVIPDEKKKG